jgi:SAM-dependent methyltransferase
VCSQPLLGAPRSNEASIGEVSDARYDGFADWFDREFATSELGLFGRRAVLELLGPGAGTLLDVGCGSAAHAAAFAELGWTVTGIDVSEDQLRLARGRGIDVRRARAEEMPFADASFDAAVSMWTHTDVDDFGAATREVARVLRPGSPLIYFGAHPCFVGPHSRFVAGPGLPELHPGYRETARYHEAPGITPDGLRAKVGASHLPLGLLVQMFLDAGFRLEHLEEPGDREYPYALAMRWRR